MRYTVLKSFPLSRDGITVKLEEAGAEIEVPADLAPGLVAARLIASSPEGGGSGRSRDPLDHDDDGKKGGSTPGQAGDAPMSVADLLAAAEVEPPMDWHTFRAEAKKFLGEDCPSKKDEIIDALKARAAAGTEAQPDA